MRSRNGFIFVPPVLSIYDRMNTNEYITYNRVHLIIHNIIIIFRLSWVVKGTRQAFPSLSENHLRSPRTVYVVHVSKYYNTHPFRPLALFFRLCFHLYLFGKMLPPAAESVARSPFILYSLTDKWIEVSCAPVKIGPAVRALIRGTPLEHAFARIVIIYRYSTKPLPNLY